MGYRTVCKHYYNMECDICGKKEEIEEIDKYNEYSWKKRRWSVFRLDYYIGAENRKCKSFGDRVDKRITLCPECTKKLKKLIKNVNFEEVQ